MKKGKMFQSKCLAWMMILVMVISMTPITAFAAENPEPNDTVVYTGETEENTVSQGDSKIAENTVTPGDATGKGSVSNRKAISDEAKALQERINALPTGEEYREMTADEQDAIYEEAAEIADAYISLSEEEQEKVDITRLEELFKVMNEGVAVLGEEETGTIGYEPLEIAAGSLNGNAIWGLTETWTTSITLDNSAAFYAQSSDRNNGTGGLPIDGKLTTTNGTPYILATGGEPATAYDGKDCIRLYSGCTSVTMNLQTIGVYQNIYVLATAGGPGAGNYAMFNVTLNYTDETTGETTYKLYDWYDLSNVDGVEKYYPVMRKENSGGSYTGTTGSTNGPILQSATIQADTTKLLKSITFNLHGKNDSTTTSGLYCGIFAVTGATPVGVPEAPVASAVMKEVGSTTGAFTAKWDPVAGATDYVIDVATDRKFTQILPKYNNKNTGNVTSYAVDDESINPNVTYFYRVRAVNDKGQSLSSNRVSTDIPVWIKNALNDGDYGKVSYDAETNTVTFKEDVTLKATLVLPAEDKTVIDLGGQTVKAPEGKPAVSAGSGKDVELSIVSTDAAGGSTGQKGSIVGNGTDASGNGAAVIDFSGASGNSAITLTQSNVTASSGSSSESGNGGNGGVGIAAGNGTKIEVGTGSTITGGDGGDGASAENIFGNGGTGGAGISGGTVTVAESGTVEGGNGGDALNGKGGTGGAGVTGSNVNNSGNVTGGNGGDGSSGGGYGGNAGTTNGTSTNGTSGSSHVHKWSYQAAGNTVYAWCVQETGTPCTYHGTESAHDNALKLTLTADNAVYSGSSYNKAVVVNEITSVTQAVAGITYAGREGTAYESTTAPVNVGKYTAKVTVGGKEAAADFEITPIKVDKPEANTGTFTYTGTEQTYTLAESNRYNVTNNKRTASGSQQVTVALTDKTNTVWNDNTTEDFTFTFTIGKAGQTATVSMANYTYGDTVSTPEVSGAEETPNVKFYYNTTNINSGGTEWKDITAITLVPGDYYIYAELGETTNYKSFTTPVKAFKVIALNMETVTAENVEKTYDGMAYGIKVTGYPEGATVKYGIKEGVYNLEHSPTYKDAAAAAHTIYYEVTKTGYNSKTGSATVTINPRTAELSWGESAFTYNGNVQAPQATVSNLVSGDSCAVTVDGGKTEAGVGTYIATATTLSNPNYTLPTTTTDITQDFTIAQREVTVAWSDTQFTYDGSAHKPSASLSGVLDGDTCNVTVSGEQTDANTSGSTYTATASIDNSNYKIKSGNETVTFTIKNASQTAPSLTPVNETIKGKADGKITGLTTAMEYRRADVSTYTTVSNAGMTFASGTYYVRYAAKINYAASPETMVAIGEGRKLRVTVPAEQTGYTLTVTADELDWHGSVTLTYTLKEGYSEKSDFAIQVNGTKLTTGTNGTYTYTISNAEVDQVITVEGVADITAPTGEITIASNKWNSFLNGFTFGLFFKETKEVEMTAADAGSGLQSISYYVSEQELNADTVQNVTAWTSYTEKFKIDPNHGYIVYAKLTDNVGNTAYLSSDGIVLYTDAWQETSAISFTRASGEDKTASVKLNGNTIRAISDGTKILTEGSDYTVSGNEITFQNSYLQSLAASETPYTLTISYHPLGREYQAKPGADGRDQNEAPATTTIKLTVTKATATITDISSLNKTYDGAPVAAPTYTDNTDATIRVEYKVKGADDSTYTETAPKNVGEYTVRLSAPATENYTAATEVRNFTIAKRDITAAVKADDKVYDGSAAATVTATAETGVAGQTLTISGLKGTFTDADGVADANVGTDKNVAVNTSAVNVSAGEEDTLVSNYRVAYAAVVNASVTAKSVTVTAVDAEKIYGDADPEFTYVISEETPLVTGESLEKILVTREEGENVKTYILTAAQAEGANSNYAITFRPGTFTIQKAVLTITPKPGQEKIYGESDPELDYEVEGLKNNEKSEDVIEGVLSREEGENAGTYSYKADTLTDKTGNYRIRLAEGSDISEFIITAKKLTDDMVWVSAKKGGTGVEVIVKDNAFGEERILTEGTDYTAAVTEEEGVYKVVITGNGNYQRSITRKVENPTWEGNIATSVVIDSSVEEVKPSLATVNETNAKDTLANIIRDPGLKAGVESGAGVDYNALLYMEMKDCRDTVTESEKQLIAEKIEEIKEIPSDSTVGMYLDLSLFMTYTISDTNGVQESGTERITDTSDAALGQGKGYYQVVTITVPEELRPGENYIRRTYYVIRVHDDGVNAPVAELLAVTQDGYVLTFKTDKFSTYAVAYSDEIIPTSVTLNTHEATITTEGGTLSLSATVAPETAVNRKVSWISGNPKVATVDENGKVTAVGNGTCIITVKTEDGGLTDTCIIKVEIPDEDDSQDNTNTPVTSEENKSIDTQVPRTGDDSNLALWIALLLLAAVVLAGVTVKRRKDRGYTER